MRKIYKQNVPHIKELKQKTEKVNLIKKIFFYNFQTITFQLSKLNISLKLTIMYY